MNFILKSGLIVLTCLPMIGLAKSPPKPYPHQKYQPVRQSDLDYRAYAERASGYHTEVINGAAHQNCPIVFIGSVLAEEEGIKINDFHAEIDLKKNLSIRCK